jgi:hypothetical protein
MSVYITVAKQTASFTEKTVEDQTVEGYDAAYTPAAPPPPDPGRAARASDSLDDPKSCTTG